MSNVSSGDEKTIWMPSGRNLGGIAGFLGVNALSRVDSHGVKPYTADLEFYRITLFRTE